MRTNSKENPGGVAFWSRAGLNKEASARVLRGFYRERSAQRQDKSSEKFDIGGFRVC